MKNRIIALVVGMVMLLFSSLHAQITFERWYGGTDDDRASSVVQTSDGGYIIAGGTDSHGAGLVDVYLVKTDSLGDTIWTRTYGGTNYDGASSIAQNPDGGYIVAGFTYSYGAGGEDVYHIKTNSNGDTLWMRTYGGADWDGAYSGAQTSDGGYVIAGETKSYGAGLYDVYLIKTDANGDTLWTKTYGGIDNERAYSVTQTSDGGYIIAGYTVSYGAGGYDVYLIKTDSLGYIGVQERKDKRFDTGDMRLTCHPNPFTTVARLEVLGSSKSTNNTLNIYDSAGRLVKSVTLETSTYELGTDLKAGIYFLKLDGKPVGKVVKVR